MQNLKLSKSFVGLLLLVVLAGGGIFTLSQLQKQQQVQSLADLIFVQWTTSQSATSACGPNGDAIITASFTNTESSSSKAMIVTVKDNQTGKSVDLGVVSAGQTKKG